MDRQHTYGGQLLQEVGSVGKIIKQSVKLPVHYRQPDLVLTNKSPREVAQSQKSESKAEYSAKDKTFTPSKQIEIISIQWH